MSTDTERRSGTDKALAMITGAAPLSIVAAIAVTIVAAPGVYSGTIDTVGPWVVESYGDWATKPIRVVWGVISGLLTYSVCQVGTYGLLRLAGVWLSMRFTAFH